MMTKSLLSRTLVCLLTLFAWTKAASSRLNYNDIKFLIAFGDSYSFVQGISGHPRHSFIGSYTDFSFTASQLLKNQIVQNFTATAEGGPNWAEFITECALPDGTYSPLNCPFQLWNFAFAGASISKEFLPQHLTATIPLVNQTQRFLRYAEPALRQGAGLNKTRSLISIWIGVNDIFDTPIYKPASMSYQQFWTNEITAVFDQSVAPLYTAGFKNFLFLNLPPLDRTSMNQKSTSPYPTKAQVDLWGSILSNQMQAFSKQRPDANAILYDANTFLNTVMNNPTRYGIVNTKTYCANYSVADVKTNAKAYGCSPLNEYFWYNEKHLSSQTHKVMAADLKTLLTSQ